MFTNIGSNYFFRTKKMETSSNVIVATKNQILKDKNHLQLLQLEDEEESWPSESNLTTNNKHNNQNNMRNQSMEVLSVDQETSIRFSFLLEKIKYFFSTSLALYCLIFVIMCISFGFSSFRASVPAQFAIAGFAFLVIFYYEGDSFVIHKQAHTHTYIHIS